MTATTQVNEQLLLSTLLTTIQELRAVTTHLQEENVALKTLAFPCHSTAKITFTHLLSEWLEKRKPFLQANTYNTYASEHKNHLYPYFYETDITLNNLSADDIEEFYSYKLLSGLSPNTVIRLHSFLYSALKYAEEKEYILKSPMRFIKRPKATPYIPNVYDIEMMQRLFVATKHLNIFPAILLSSTLGLRRSEIASLTWESINFTTRAITIRQKKIKANFTEHDLKQLKTQTSYRCLSLPTVTLNYLKKLKADQEQMKAICKNKSLIQNFNFVCLDKNYKRVTLERISGAFRDFIDNNSEKFMKIRFHDLRHSCACILLNLGCNMKKVQEWLGHSNFAFTAQVYIHLTAKEKEYAALRLNEALRHDMF